MKRSTARIPRSLMQLHFRLCDSSPIRVTLDEYPLRQAAPLFDVHYEMELGIVLSGRMRRIYKGCETVCRPGDAWFCGMWEPHGFAVENAPCRVLVLVIWPPLPAGMRFPECPGLSWMTLFSLPPALRPKSSPALRKAALSAASRIRRAMDKNTPLTQVKVKLALFELLAEFMERLPLAVGRKQAPAVAAGIYEKISRAIDEVFQSGSRVSCRQAAAAAGLGPDKFRRDFARAMGMSFAAFALQHRLSRAAELLAASEKPIKLVAYETGFNDESHLTKVFLKHYARTPGEYRRRCAGRPGRTSPSLRAP